MRSARVCFTTLAMGVLLGLPGRISAAPADQPLSIILHGDGARATQLPQYDPGTPLAVTVHDTSGQLADAVTVIAVGPRGESIQSSLTHLSEATFGGTLTLDDPGSWRLHLTTRAGRVATDTTPILVDVQAPAPSDAWEIGLAVGTAIFVTVGGSGFLVLRRAAHTRDAST